MTGAGESLLATPASSTKAITVDQTGLPLFTDARGLVAAFKTNGSSVLVGSKNQESGKTANDFSRSVTYTVTAADGSKASYVVRALLGKITSISGYSDTLMVGSDGSLWATGYNNNGELGNGSTTGVLKLVQIRPPSLSKDDQG